ncbi:tail fiber assembly protein [Escherichia coli]|nr:tail fiber assembly protein [Escherichia coli]HBH9804718.1 tail fiber assembly protein [Escherichia coli]HCL6625236.1 tail fiber assembly protein [Escherichia coli]HCQ6488672.1 tail fiber assembly protein [Escherichia coli]HDC0139174.1 tail fiber assembly protein [Escherichia coli]
MREHMNNFKNFAPYTPGEDKRELVDAGVLFLLDENGNDWYECQKLFSECTKVIAYDSNNIVVSITDDASTLWPIGLSVAEVDGLPEDVDINGGWVFRDNSVVKRIYSDTELQQQAESKKAALLSHAESVIVTLERAVKLNMATDEERAKLEAWERYSVLVYRVDTAKPEWPEEP